MTNPFGEFPHEAAEKVLEFAGKAAMTNVVKPLVEGIHAALGDPPRLRQISGDINSRIASEISNAKIGLEDAVGSVKSYWTGEGADALQAYSGEIGDATQHAVESAQKIAKSVDKLADLSHENYNACIEILLKCSVSLLEIANSAAQGALDYFNKVSPFEIGKQVVGKVFEVLIEFVKEIKAQLVAANNRAQAIAETATTIEQEIPNIIPPGSRRTVMGDPTNWLRKPKDTK